MAKVSLQFGWFPLIWVLAFGVVPPSAHACDFPVCKEKSQESEKKERKPSSAYSDPTALVGDPQLKSPISLQPSWYSHPQDLTFPPQASHSTRKFPLKALEAPAASTLNSSESFNRLIWLRN